MYIKHDKMQRKLTLLNALLLFLVVKIHKWCPHYQLAGLFLRLSKKSNMLLVKQPNG